MRLYQHTPDYQDMRVTHANVLVNSSCLLSRTHTHTYTYTVLLKPRGKTDSNISLSILYLSPVLHLIAHGHISTTRKFDEKPNWNEKENVNKILFAECG